MFMERGVSNVDALSRLRKISMVIFSHCLSHVYPMEVYITEKCSSHERIVDKATFEKVFASSTRAAQSKRVAAAAAKTGIAVVQAQEKVAEDEDDKAVKAATAQKRLTNFFNKLGWAQVEKTFLLSYNKMKALVHDKTGAVAHDLNTAILIYSNVEWRTQSKVKAAPREFAPILGALLFEKAFTEIYRPSLLSKTPAGDLRELLASVLNQYTYHRDKQGLVTEADAPNAIQRYRFWDRLDLKTNLAIFENNSSEANLIQLDRVIKAREFSTKIKRFVISLEKLVSVNPFDGTTSSNIPSEMSIALNHVVRVSTHLA